ncbi:MAG: HAD family hydrolase [Patescibacteria group bacterium]|nr:HAD hydrolase-like protein [Patescibacteria group bacterium]
MTVGVEKGGFWYDVKNMKIKAVLFDLGGVYFEDGTDKFLKILSGKTGKSYQDLYSVFREGKSLEYRKNEISGKDFFDWASKQVNAGLLGNELNEMWVSQYTEMPGIRKLIEGLKEKGIRVAVLSDNVPERISYLENKYHFLSLFDDVVLSYQVNLTKTSAEIFRFALSRLKIKPEEAVLLMTGMSI